MKNKSDFIAVDKSWTLFLDRDGVINKEEIGSYVVSPDDFEFLPGVLTALKYFAKTFDRIVLVTNQQGVAKGLLTIADLDDIHEKMLAGMKEAGGRMDALYYCAELASDNPPCRKPEIGMAKQAKEHFPAIDFEKSIMIGNYITDMEFARNAGMLSVLVEDRQRITPENSHLIDYYFSSLQSASESIGIVKST